MAQSARRGGARLVERLVTWWALVGGAVLLALIAMSVWSVLGGVLLGAPFAGDFELMQMGIAIAAFAFLPYSQLTGANVTADIFTMRASPRAVAWMAVGGAAVALGFSLLLLWRMSAGLEDYRRYEETTTILQIPHWIAFVPILASLVLLAAASLVTLAESLRGTEGR